MLKLKIGFSENEMIRNVFENEEIVYEQEVKQLNTYLQAAAMQVDYGYDKTWFEVLFNGEKIYTGRIDLNKGHYNLHKHILTFLDMSLKFDEINKPQFNAYKLMADMLFYKKERKENVIQKLINSGYITV